jgi:transcriptional regulator with XRE-family HTH domain
MTLKTLRSKTKLSQERLARMLDTSWTTVSRWERNVSIPQPDLQARIRRLETLLERIGDALPPEEIPRFLETPHVLLRGHAPVDLLKSEYSFEDLLAFVDSAKSGDMA